MKRLKRLFLARAAMTLLAFLLGSQTGAWATITGDGSATAPFVIHDADDWAAFAANVNDGTTYENLYVKLSDDFDNSSNAVTAKVGTVSGSTQGNPFKGIFDGNGKTLYVNITDDNNQGTAPFCYISGATIKNLTVAGSVNSQKEHAAGLVGFSKDPNNHIVDCIVSATVNGGTHVGGILGHGLNSNVAIERCVFSGTITGGGTAKGVIFGWGDNGGTKSITDCLYVMQSGQNTSNLDLVKLSGGSVAVTRCYKTTSAGNYGTQVFTTAPDNEISIQQTLADGNTYYIPCTISGLQSNFSYTGSAITLSYTVTDANGTELTKDTHYNEELQRDGNAVNEVKELGTYTLTITAVSGSGYTGSKSVTFTVKYQLTVNDGTTTNGYVPVYGYYVNYITKSQFIIPASELETIKYGTINKLTFYAQADKNWGNAQFEVYMIETTNTTLSALADYATMDKVMNAGSLSISGGKMEVTLDAPYKYEGGNLMIGFLQTVTGTSGSCSWYGVSATGASLGGYGTEITQQNFLPKTTIDYTPGEAPVCAKPVDLTISYEGGTTAIVSWMSDEMAFDIDVNGTVTENVTNPYELTGLELDNIYVVKVRAKNENGKSDWTSPVSFTTDLCLPEDMCEITFELTDNYGDGWNGNAIKVVDVETGKVLGTFANTSDAETYTQTYTLSLCDGRKVEFQWVNGSYASETSYVVYDADGEEIFSGSGAMSKPVSYTMSCNPIRRPTDLTVTGMTLTTAKLAWTENGTATAWEICLNDNENNLITADSNPFTLTGLIPETAYTAKVRSVDSDGTSDWSAAISFEPTDKIVIGSGTATNSYIPTSTYYNQSLTQQIYTAAELGEAGLIESIDFYCATAASSTTRVLDIYMVSTDKSSFSGNTDWITVTAADKVYSGSCLFAAGWNSFTLDEPFVYNGTQNVAIIVDDNAGDYDKSNSFRVYDANAQALYIHNDGTNYDPTAPSSYSGTVLNVKNQIRILKSPLSDCIKPTNFKATEVGPDQATLSWEELGTATAWVICLNGDENNLIPSDRNPYTLTGLTPETEYTVKVRPACDESLWSTAITFTTTKNNPVPTNLAASNITPTTATISWTGFSDSYLVVLGTFPDGALLLNENFDNEEVPANWSNDSTYPWTIKKLDDGFCLQSGNAGQASSSSSISVTVDLLMDGTVDFDAQCMGEGTNWDKCIFLIDDEVQFTKGANGEQWEHYSFDVAAGEHTFTWKYTKDNSVNGEGDHFAIDNVVMKVDVIDWNEPVSTADAEYTFENLSTGTSYFVKVVGVKDEASSEESEVMSFTTLSSITLANDDSGATERNSAIIDANNGKAAQVTLADRTLYKDGDWNTLCLPFNLVLEGSPLEDAEARTLDEARIDGTTLILNFSDLVSELTAGTPYIIKWDSGSDIVNPVFNGVTIDKTSRDKAFAGVLTFKGNYDYQSFTEDNHSILFMDGGNTLNWPKKDASIGACRAYFQLADGITADSVNNARLFFGSDDTQGIISIDNGQLTIDNETGSWYTVNGVKVEKPKRKGLYIQNGRKVVIK